MKAIWLIVELLKFSDTISKALGGITIGCVIGKKTSVSTTTTVTMTVAIIEFSCLIDRYSFRIRCNCKDVEPHELARLDDPDFLGEYL